MNHHNISANEAHLSSPHVLVRETRRRERPGLVLKAHLVAVAIGVVGGVIDVVTRQPTCITLIIAGATVWCIWVGRE